MWWPCFVSHVTSLLRTSNLLTVNSLILCIQEQLGSQTCILSLVVYHKSLVDAGVHWRISLHKGVNLS